MKGTLYCGRCRQRMTITHAKNRHGNIYPYFICLGRNNKRTDCTLPSAPVDRVEKLIAEHHNDYQGARALIDGALDLARDFARVYERCDDQNKRLANQTFFSRIYLDEGGHLTADTAAPFEAILDDTTLEQALDPADQRSETNEKSDVVTQDLFPQARVTISLIECARGGT